MPYFTEGYYKAALCRQMYKVQSLMHVTQRALHTHKGKYKDTYIIVSMTQIACIKTDPTLQITVRKTDSQSALRY